MIDQKMGYFHAGFLDLGGKQVYVSCTGWTGELGFDIYSRGDQTDYHRHWQHVIDAGTLHGMVYGSISSMEVRRIEAGILDNLMDFDISMTPFQAGLGNFLDLDKEGFVGREALREVDRRTLLYGLKCPSATPAMNSDILDGHETIGRVTAGAWSSFLDCGIGYVRFDQPGDWAGRNLELKTSAGENVPCEIIDLPFYDLEKRIPRGLDRTII
jgi:aminomethyltransferase